MLRITPCINSRAAKSYFQSAFSVNDYYAERSDHQETIGKWSGRGAERLGLVGDVDQERFDLLVENIDPNTNRNLTPLYKEGRRCGYDFTFSLSKGASFYFAMTKDERVMIAFDEAVNETLAEMESDVRTRVRKHGQNGERITGEFTVASFDHFTARPVGGVPDPHVHRHCFVFNQTWDAVEARWKALDIATIKRDASYYQEAFHACVAAKLRDSGLAVERNANNYDLAGFERETIEKFSARTEEIERIASEKGITDATAKSALGAATRDAKQKEMSLSELRDEWNGRLSDAERKAIGTIARGKARPKTEEVTPAQAVDFALAKAFERASVTSEKKLLAEALRHGVGSCTVEEIREEFFRRDAIITREVEGQRLSTTREVLAEETRMIQWCQNARGKCFPLVSSDRAIQDERLSAEQIAAVRHLWESTDRVTLVRGSAGVGKTSLLKEAVMGIESEGIQTFAFTVSAEASRGVLVSEGFKDATTLAALFNDPKMQERVKGQVILVDEAGTLGVPTLNRLFELADRQDAKIILVGDSGQHFSVERGDALRVLETQGGIHAAHVGTVRRQVDERYRDAVMAASKGDAGDAFDKLAICGFVREVEGKERHTRLAGDYLDTLNAGKSALVVAPTHAECGAVTREVRAGLRERGKLDGEDIRFLQLRNLQRTQAERGDAVLYRVGDVVQMTLNAKGFTRGERLEVVGRGDDGSVMVERHDGEVIPLPLSQANRFQHYEKKEVPLAVGDRLRITQNGYTKDGKHRLNNGDTKHLVAGFTKAGDIKLENGWIVAKDFGHLSHGYASTSHAAQGKTVDRVFVGVGSESFSAANREQFYVSISRGREQCVLYTDDAKSLRLEIAQSGRRMSAIEMMGAHADGLAAQGREARQREQAAVNARLKARAAAQAARSTEELREHFGPAPQATRENAAKGAEHGR